MAQPNPFEQPQQQPPAAPQQPNPYSQAAPAAAAPAPNPFGPGVQQAAPAPAPAAPQAYAPAQPTTQQQFYGATPAPAPVAPSPYGNPYGVAPGGQHAPAVYGGPQQQAAPAHVPAGPPPAIDRSRLGAAPPPPPSGDGKGAKFPHMYGRLCLFFPLTVTRKARNPQFITQEQRQRGDIEQDQITATVVVLDDGNMGNTPITFGGDPAAFPPIPDTESAPLPYVRKGMWITQSKVIEQLRPHLGGGMVAGRMRKAGPNRNDPWFIEAATAEELARCDQYLALVEAGTFEHPLA